MQLEVPTHIDDLDLMEDEYYTSYEYSIWRRVLFQPIQRGYPGFSYPLSFEVLLTSVRAHDRRYGCPKKVHDFLQSEMSLVHGTDSFLLRHFGYLINLPAKPALFKCGKCSWII